MDFAISKIPQRDPYINNNKLNNLSAVDKSFAEIMVIFSSLFRIL